MYAPRHFREERIPVLHDAIRRLRFATLVSTVGGELFASHLPFLLDTGRGPLGTLVGHLARPNPHWRDGDDPGATALAVFLGPNTYVSPSWYASKAEHGKVVPTWNYVAVHAHGPLRAVEDPRRLREIVAGLTRQSEAERTDPWGIEDAPDDYIATRLRGIVGVEVPIARLAGKWKLSQNQPAGDFEGVVQGLEAQGGCGAQAVAAAMREIEPR